MTSGLVFQDIHLGWNLKHKKRRNSRWNQMITIEWFYGKWLVSIASTSWPGCLTINRSFKAAESQRNEHFFNSDGLFEGVKKNWTTRIAFCNSKVHSNKTLHFLAHHFIKMYLITFSPLMSDSLPGLYYKGSTNEKILCVFSIDLIQKYFKYTSCYINFRLAAFLSGEWLKKKPLSPFFIIFVLTTNKFNLIHKQCKIRKNSKYLKFWI